MLPASQEHQAELLDLCRRYRVRRLDLFGSATGAKFDPARSDLDFLVEFEDLRTEDAADRYLGLLVDLEDLFGRKVDLVTSGGRRNPFFREEVERTRVPLYAAGDVQSLVALAVFSVGRLRPPHTHLAIRYNNEAAPPSGHILSAKDFFNAI